MRGLCYTRYQSFSSTILLIIIICLPLVVTLVAVCWSVKYWRPFGTRTWLAKIKNFFRWLFGMPLAPLPPQHRTSPNPTPAAPNATPLSIPAAAALYTNYHNLQQQQQQRRYQHQLGRAASMLAATPSMMQPSWALGPVRPSPPPAAPTAGASLSHLPPPRQQFHTWHAVIVAKGMLEALQARGDPSASTSALPGLAPHLVNDLPLIVLPLELDQVKKWHAGKATGAAAATAAAAAPSQPAAAKVGEGNGEQASAEGSGAEVDSRGSTAGSQGMERGAGAAALGVDQAAVCVSVEPADSAPHGSLPENEVTQPSAPQQQQQQHRHSMPDVPSVFLEALLSAESCAICLELFEKEQSVRLLPACHHIFHAECIDPWLQSSAMCALCRAVTLPMWLS